MPIEIGRVEALFRYPVKSMRGETLETADLGWHGIEGDRRFAFRKRDDRGHFPWLSASRLPDLLRFASYRNDPESPADAPTHVRTPEGADWPILSDGLSAEVGGRLGAPVEMMQLRTGIFDDAAVSVIASSTVDEICRLAGVNADVRRFRPNVLVRLQQPGAFREDAWVGGVLTFGEGPDAPAVSVTLRDLRCSMVNLDPDSALSSPGVMKVIAGANQNHAGVYGAVTRAGRLAAGQTVYLHAAGA